MIYSKFKNTLTEFLTSNPQVNRLCVAYSGGLDSSVLLKLCSDFCKDFSLSDKNISLRALHVNHGLSKNSSEWEKYCIEVCKGYGCDFVSQEVTIEQDKNIEQQARNFRYQFFEVVCKETDVLLTAHHVNDQVETLLFRFFRGASPKSLMGIPEQRSLNKLSPVQILRPLLSENKQELLEYATQEKVTWVEDESNVEEKYNRNFIRHSLLPGIRKHWPQIDKNLTRSARFFSESQTLLSDLAAIDLESVFNQDELLLRWGDSLALQNMKMLSFERKKNVLRFWIESYGLDLPSENGLLEILSLMEGSKRESTGEIYWKQDNTEVFFRVFENHLFIHKRDLEDGGESDAPKRWDFSKQNVLNCYHQQFQVICSKESLNQSKLKTSHTQFNVRFRNGGERCQPTSRQHSQSLKKLFQEYRIPPWERDIAPLLYIGEDIAAVADFWVCEGFQAELEAEGWLIKR